MAVPAWVTVVDAPASRSWASRAALMALAIPKSITMAVPPERSTLAGLMSR